MYVAEPDPVVQDARSLCTMRKMTYATFWVSFQASAILLFTTRGRLTLRPSAHQSAIALAIIGTQLPRKRR
jgi:hypothetical protein